MLIIVKQNYSYLITNNELGLIKSDLVEGDNEFKLYCELPGIKKEDIDVSIDNNVVTITGTKDQSSVASNEWYHIQERQAGKYQRSIRLPANADGSRAVANNVNGVIVLTFPKLASSATHRKLLIA